MNTKSGLHNILVLLSISYALFSTSSINASEGISVFNDNVLQIPSVKISSDVYFDIYLTSTKENTFLVTSNGEKTTDNIHAAANFNGKMLSVRNIDYNGIHFSNVVFEYVGGLNFIVRGFDTPRRIFGTSYENQQTDIWVDHYATRDSEIIKYQRDVNLNGFKRPQAITYFDFDNDGDDDIYMSLNYHPAGLEYTLENFREVQGEIYRQNSDGTFSYDDSMLNGAMPGLLGTRKAISADFNGDRYPDLMVGESGFDAPPFPGGKLSLFISNIDGTYDTRLIGPTAFHHGLAAGDVDGDGDVDVYTSNAHALINDGIGNFEIIQNFKGIESYGVHTIEIIDLNQDGYNEIITTGHTWDTPTRIYHGDTTYSYTNFTELVPDPTYGVVTDIDIGDLNNDGLVELVLNSTGGPDEFYVGSMISAVTIDSSLSAISSYSIYEDANAPWIVWLKVFDYNNDGFLDIADDDKGLFSLLQNNGDMSFSKIELSP